jgi:alkaline phosphatase
MFRSARSTTGVLAVAGLAAGVLALQAPVSAGTPVFRLQLLHASDLEGGVAAIDRAPNFAAIVDALEDAPGMGASITLSAGDNYIPGPFFSAAGDPSVAPALAAANGIAATTASAGRADASIMNVVGFDASALGNHEFDLGSREVRNIIAAAGTWPGVQFPYLSANLNFAGDADLNSLFQAPPSILASSAYRSGGAAGARKIAPYTVIEEGGERIGVVGATTPILQTISSPTGTTVIGPNTNDMPALAAVLQPRINELIATGVNKVVLVSHLQQISLEQTLASLLTGVDVIVAGGSDTILANADDTLQPGATADGGYPFLAASSTGDPVAIVSTDGEYTYVGRLVVDFDAAGVLVAPDGSPLDQISDLDLALNGPVATTNAQVTGLWGAGDPFAAGTKGQRVQSVVDAVENVVIAKDSTVFGESTVFIDGRRSEVRTQETTLGNLSADANLFVARQSDPTVRVSIKNGGGIRAEIGEVRNSGSTTQFLPPQANPTSGKLDGQISQLDIENSLRFNNGLSLVTTTAAGFLGLVEHGVRATVPGATPGQFPQVGGFTFTFDPTLPAGNRVESLIVGEGASQEVLVANSEIVGDPTRPIRLVTLNFLANGGDGYPFGPVASQVDRVDLVQPSVRDGAALFADNGSEQDAFAEYLVVNHGIGAGTPFSGVETSPALDARVRNLAAVPTTVSVTALDGDAAEEGVDPGTVRFTRTGGLGAPLTVTYTIGGTASSADYLPALTGTVDIPALSATADVTITPIDDVVVEGAESVEITVIDAAAYDPGTPVAATITIADNDVAPGVDLSAFRQYGAADGIAGAEIVSVRGDRAVVSDANGNAYVLDANDLLDMKVLNTVPGLAGLNSVAIHPTANYFLAVGGPASPSAAPVAGTLWAYGLDGTLLGSVATGLQPDSVAITPDGSKAVIANEAEGIDRGENGGPGSLTVVNLTGATNPLGAVTQIPLPSYAGVSGFSTGRTDDLARLAITNEPATLEPESVAFDASSAHAYISLQENNAVLKLDLATNAVTPFGLGTTTHLMDVSTSGGYVPATVRTELREPDGIAVLTIGGVEYFVTADEGDTRTGAGSSDVRGGRTVSVFRADTGAFVGDTGKGLDDAAARFGVYPDSRSNRGGSEPEVLDATVFNGTPVAVVGLERANRLAVIDLSVPSAPTVVGLLPAGNRPEGVKLVERNGALFAVVGNEGDGTPAVPGSVTVTRVPIGDEIFTQRFVEDIAGPVHDLVAVTSDPARQVDVTLTLDDPAAGSLSATTFSGPASTVNTELAGVTFTPAPNWNGTVEVTVSVTAGAATDTGFVTLVVAPVDDAPTLRLVNTASLCLGDDLVTVSVRLSDIDSPASALRLTARSTNTSLVRSNALSLLGNGSSRLLVVQVSNTTSVTNGSVVLTLSDAANTVTVPIGVVGGTNRADVLNVDPSAASIVVGRSGNDTITGGPLTDIICGGFGNDTIDAAGGNDAMFGGFGNDRLTGGAGADLFSGGFGIDRYVDVSAAAGDIAWWF